MMGPMSYDAPSIEPKGFPPQCECCRYFLREAGLMRGDAGPFCRECYKALVNFQDDLVNLCIKAKVQREIEEATAG